MANHLEPKPLKANAFVAAILDVEPQKLEILGLVRLQLGIWQGFKPITNCPEVVLMRYSVTAWETVGLNAFQSRQNLLNCLGLCLGF
jgi:hypothetical protein